jgi:hypothetical protein
VEFVVYAVTMTAICQLPNIILSLSPIHDIDYYF